MRASTNPLAYCEGGFYGGYLGLHDKIKPLLKTATASFGITAFNELQRLYNGKSLVEDGTFAIEVLKHINEKVEQFKHQDGNLYAIYATPAENLCGLQVKQFRKKYWIFPPLESSQNRCSRFCFSIGVMSSVTWQWKPMLTYSRSETFSTIPYFFRNCFT